MSDFIMIGKRLVPRGQIALVETYEAGERSRLQTTRDFKARVVLLNRDSLLVEQTPEAFAESSGLRMLPTDRSAINRTVQFSVEKFEPSEGFTPAKPYTSRLRWRDLDGNEQSKLLLTDPETVLAVISGTQTEAKLPPARGNGTRPRRARQSGSTKQSLSQA